MLDIWRGSNWGAGGKKREVVADSGFKTSRRRQTEVTLYYSRRQGK